MMSSKYKRRKEVYLEIPNKTYNRSFLGDFTEIILCKQSRKSFGDGQIVEISPTDEVDSEVINELKKLGYENVPLKTFVQYVSNDNC